MFDFEELIGLEIEQAKELLSKKGFNDIEIILNSEHNDKYDKTLVCAVRKKDEKITLICGRFFFGLKKE